MSSPNPSSLDFDLPTTLFDTLFDTLSDIASEFDSEFNFDLIHDIIHDSVVQDVVTDFVTDSLDNISEDILPDFLLSDTLISNIILPRIENSPNLEDLASFTTDFLKRFAQMDSPASNFSRLGGLPANALPFATITNSGKRIDNGQGNDLGQQRKWTKRSDSSGATIVTFAFDDSFSVNGISTERAKTLLASALQTWADYAPLDFVEIADPGSGDSVDIFVESKAIDGQGKTLAFAFFPAAGDITFDTGEVWSENKFLETAVHELGHSLGLDHEDDSPAIMNSVLSNRFTNEPFLLEDDIRGIRSLYGTGKGSVTTLAEKSGGTTPRTTTGSVSAPAAAANLAVNGSFEEVPLAVGESGVYSSIKGWSTMAGTGFQVDRRPALAGQAAEGTTWVELDAYGVNNTIGQNVDTLTGEIYQVSVSFSDGGRAERTTLVEVFWEGEKVDTLSGGGKGQWRNFSYQLQGGDRDVSTLAFRAIGPNDDVGGYIDNVVITAAKGALNQGLGSTPTLNRDPISGEPQDLMAADLTTLSLPTAFV